ncbi:unnamed protein product [Diabrotica balteata]|uniref:BED-type domain-containing protein n=1 Tax=Diabrotica balteata TaxID=107213 RepID=A0A9N9STL3_DIABA|nr:unnamed protein product [Diabrotica balteata]
MSEYIFNKTKNRNTKKINKITSKINDTENKLERSWVENLTTVEIPNDVQEILSLGDNFAVPIHNKNEIPVSDIICSIENSISNLNETSQHQIRTKCLWIKEEWNQRDLSNEDNVADPNFTPEVECHVQLSVPSCSYAPKKSRKSKFDNFYEIANDRLSATCKLCLSVKKKNVKLSMSHRSTSGLRKHLRRAHIDEYNLQFPENIVPTDSPQKTLK